VEAYGSIIRDIAVLLKRAGAEFGYLYEDELYTGALAFDLGADAQFVAHARRVYAMLKEHGVRSLITVDPHTYNMLHSVYPTVVEGFDLEVRSYLEVLAAGDLQPRQRVEQEEVVVHDSCVYARYEGLIEEPRTLLARAGYAVREPADSGRYTHCCGGPVESLFPKTAHRIGARRVQQLEQANGGQGVTMCPICLATLKKASTGELEVDDISRFLARAYCAPEGTTG